MGSMSLAGGASTQSRGRRPIPPGAVSARTVRTRGVHELVLFEYDDKPAFGIELLSWVGGQSGLLWGGGPWPLKIDAVDRQLRMIHGSYGHAAEYALADALGEVFDGYITSPDMSCRFFQSGGEACSAAVRIARAATGRDAIATQGYHGAATDFAHEPAWMGYPRTSLNLIYRFEFGDVDGMKKAIVPSNYRKPIASCIMVEVPAWDDEAAIAAFLRECRRVADESDIPLIIDDVVCGFRLALAGSCERYGVKADMIILGKAMSAMGCVSAVVGRADLVGRLGEDVFFSTTFGGSPGPCSVAAATVRWLAEHHEEVYGRITRNTSINVGDYFLHEPGRLASIGHALKDGLNARGIKCVGQPERSIVVFDTDDEWLTWCGKMIEQGVMIHRPQFPTLVHTMKDVEMTLRAVEAIR